MKRLAAWLQGLSARRRAQSLAHKVYILDAATLSGSSGAREPDSPREVLHWLQRLDRLCQKEKLRLHAIFVCEPLRKVPAGEKRDGVGVHYATSRDARIETAIRLIEKFRRGHAVTVITSDPVLEQRAWSLGCAVMRAPTFRKAMDLSLGGGQRDGQGDESRYRRGESQRSQKRNRRPPRSVESDTNQNAPSPSPPVAAEPTISSAGPSEASPSTSESPAENPSEGLRPAEREALRKFIDLVE